VESTELFKTQFEIKSIIQFECKNFVLLKMKNVNRVKKVSYKYMI